ncbi:MULTISPECIES: dsDNA nuclease domain-containing protein [unclassified Streptomyces]|uniref:dsDNA nuclease domain-containing protein n=1 Tax=unclassified Streptomyces TaxID=2593676 RepID=UPI00382AD035
MQGDGTRRAAPAAGSPGVREATDVLNGEQLRRITSTHRGFTYQHLYAAGCLLRLREAQAQLLRVERDEDVEIVFDDRHLYIQVKTREGNLTWGDVRGAVEQFDGIRAEHTAGRRAGTPWLIVVTNAALGPDLLARTQQAPWPADVALVGPERPHPAERWLPVPGRDLADLLDWCTAQAERLPFGSLSAATLVWKLAARVQYACTGAHGQEFAATKLPQLYEQFVEELQAFPQLPGVYRPHDGEPDLASEEPVRLVVGFSGAGKTTWAAHAATHCPHPVTYFDVAGIPSASVPGALAQELAARHLSQPEAETLPAADGIAVLRAVHARLAQAGTMIAVVVDNVHQLTPDEVRMLVGTLPTARLILLGHPRPEQIPLAAHLGITAEALAGWSIDTVAAVFAAEDCVVDYGTVQRVLALTAGLPLYVLNSAYLTSTAYAGDGTAFCDALQAQTHTTGTAQERILEEAFALLELRARTVAALLAIAEVPLAVAELQRLAEVAGLRPAHAARAVRDLAARRFTQDFADGRVTLHDAVRPVASSAADDLPNGVTHRVRDALLQMLEGQRGLPQLGRWMRLLTETGRVEELLDLASEEGFYESGYPREIRAAVADAAEDLARDTVIRFEAHNTLVTWAYYDGDWQACARHVSAMERLAVNGDSGIGPRESALLAARQFIVYGHDKDVRRLTEAFTTGLRQVESESAEERALRYSFAQALYHADEFDRADVVAQQVAEAYRAYLGLSLDDLDGPIAALQERLHASDSPDDYKRLADCFSLSVKSRRRQGVASGPETVVAIPAWKLYSITGAWRQAVDSGQEVVDILVNAGRMQQALNILERQLLPMAETHNLPELIFGLRSHRAVTLAYTSDIPAALAEIDSLSGYEPTPEQAADFCRQKAIIEALAARQRPPAR